MIKKVYSSPVSEPMQIDYDCPVMNNSTDYHYGGGFGDDDDDEQP